MRKSYFIFVGLLCLLLGGSFFATGYLFYKSIFIDTFENKETGIICPEDSFSIRDFVLELHIQEVKYPDIVLRQACCESAWFTSPAWRNRHNPFGFYYKGEYIFFNDWKSAIIYMREWQDRHYKGGEYYLFLERLPYALDTNYISTLKSMDMNNLRTLK